jgi:hypothetical protein
MGRHSAPDDDEPDGESPADAELADRHDQQEVVVDDETAVVETAAVGNPAAAPAPARESATQADLRLLREQPALRARCAAGLLVPFVIFALVVALIGVSDFLVWVWIPAVAAGILVGSFIDAAHKAGRDAV